MEDVGPGLHMGVRQLAAQPLGQGLHVLVVGDADEQLPAPHLDRAAQPAGEGLERLLVLRLDEHEVLRALLVRARVLDDLAVLGVEPRVALLVPDGDADVGGQPVGLHQLAQDALALAGRLTADIRVTVWDEDRDAWLDAEGGEVVEDPRAGEEGPEYFVLVESEDQALLEQLSTRMREGRPVELRRGMLLVGSFDDEEVEELGERLRGEVGDRGRVQVRADIFSDLPSPGFLLFETRMPGM